MEGNFIKENVVLTRAEMDRILRSYRTMNEALRSSSTFLRAENIDLDESAIQAEMCSIFSFFNAFTLSAKNRSATSPLKRSP